MFERFTPDARSVVARAQDEARAMRNPCIGTEHLCLSMIAGDSAAGVLLQERGMTAGAARARLRAWAAAGDSLDPAALAALGIDLDAVRRATEERFGAGALDVGAKRMPGGHIPFSKRAKKVLELAVRQAVALDAGEINSAHLLLGILAEDEGLGARLIRDAGIDFGELATAARLTAIHRAA